MKLPRAYLHWVRQEPASSRAGMAGVLMKVAFTLKLLVLTLLRLRESVPKCRKQKGKQEIRHWKKVEKYFFDSP